MDEGVAVVQPAMHQQHLHTARKMEDGGWMMEDVGWMMEDGGRHLLGRVLLPPVETPYSAPGRWQTGTSP